MAKRLVVKTGEYTNQQGETKGEYTKIGVILENQNGEFILMDPAVNLAGVLLKQNALSAKQGKQPSDSVMVSVFTDDNATPQQQPQAPQQPQQGYSQQQPTMNQQQPNPHDFNNGPQPTF